MKRVFQKPYVFGFVSIFLLYVVLAILLSGFYNTIYYIPYYLTQINWIEFGLSIVFTLVIAFLVALNGVYAFIKFKERRKIKGASLSCAGTIVGLTTGVCPACVTGVFPLLLSSLGIAFSYGSLPFKGLEVQFFTIVLLGFSVYILKRKK